MKKSLQGYIASMLVKVSVVTLLILPVTYSANADNRGSSGWKDWNDWIWDIPTCEEVKNLLPDGRTIGLLVDFVSIWDDRFKNDPTAADGFLVLHICSTQDIQNAVVGAIAPTGMKVLGSASHYIGFLEGGAVKSVFVPVKAPGETGEFELKAVVEEMNTEERTARLIYVIKKHRREIYGQTWGEYVQQRRQERLASAVKREGAEFYDPSDYCEPGPPLPEEDSDYKINPVMQGYTEMMESLEIPAGESNEIEDHPEWFMDVDVSEPQSVNYIFRGQFYYEEAETGDTYPVVRARVWILDDDSEEESRLLQASDLMCETYTDDNGYFWCTAAADDTDGFPDPFVTIFPISEDVKVKDCSPAAGDDWIGWAFQQGNMWVDMETGQQHWPFNLPPGYYRLWERPIVLVGDPLMERQFMAYAEAKRAVKRNLDAWRATIDPSRTWLGEHKICHPPEDGYSTCHRRFWNAKAAKWDHEICLEGDDAKNFSVIGHEFGHSLHQWIIGLSNDVPGFSDHGFCQFGQSSSGAFGEGFATATSMYIYDAPYYTSLPPWEPKPGCSRRGGTNCGEGFEGSKVHWSYENHDSLEWYFDEMNAWMTGGTGRSVGDFPYGWVKGPCYWSYNAKVWRGVQTALCEEYPVGSHYCPQAMFYWDDRDYLRDNSEKAKKGSGETLVAGALWDIYDGWGGDDRSCYYHFWTHWREACDSAYLLQDEASWGLVLLVMEGDGANYGGNPRDFYQFAEGLIAVTGTNCEGRNYLRTVARFNGITLKGLHGANKWENCDKFPPEETPPCAATEAVVEAVEGEDIDEPITQEEGEELLSKIRRIRDEYLMKSDRGRFYAFLYSTCSDEIISGITGNPETLSASLDLMLDAAYKLENIDDYLNSGESPIDETFVYLAAKILDELKSHTSEELLSSIEVIEGDLQVTQGMTVQELFHYFGWEE